VADVSLGSGELLRARDAEAVQRLLPGAEGSGPLGDDARPASRDRSAAGEDPLDRGGVGCLEERLTHLRRRRAEAEARRSHPDTAFRPQFTDRMDDAWRRIYDEHLLNGFLAAVPGLADRLAAGARVLDLGCGTGHAVNLMAQAYPRSTLVGCDIAADAIERAERERVAMGVPNARFGVLDAAQLPVTPQFDVITAFDAIHDQVAPDVVLRRVHDALRPDGVFMMVDFKFSSRLERNLANRFAPLYYAISVMHCMTVSLAEGGAGLGTVWGEELARKMLAEAGFGSVEVIDAPRPQNCIYFCRPASDDAPDE
jgi:SAM-dependent methyltransferase